MGGLSLYQSFGGCRVAGVEGACSYCSAAGAACSATSSSSLTISSTCCRTFSKSERALMAVSSGVSFGPRGFPEPARPPSRPARGVPHRAELIDEHPDVLFERVGQGLALPDPHAARAFAHQRAVAQVGPFGLIEDGEQQGTYVLRDHGPLLVPRARAAGRRSGRDSRRRPAAITARAGCRRVS